METATQTTRKAARTPALLDFERPSVQTFDAETFFRYSAQYPNREGTATYVYRLKPKIDRSLSGQTVAYIAVESQPVTLDYLRDNFGSGSYQLQFVDNNKPRGTQQRAKTSLDLEEPNFPPVLNPGELDLDALGVGPLADRYLSSGWVVQDFQQVQKSGRTVPRRRLVPVNPAGPGAATVLPVESAPAPGGTVAANAALGAMAPLMGLVDKFLALTQPKSDVVETAFKIAERLKPAPAPDAIGLMKAVIDVAGAMNGRGLAPAAPPQSPLAMVKELADAAKALGFKPPGGGGSNGVNWGDTVSSIFESLPGILSGGAQLLNGIAVIRFGPSIAGRLPTVNMPAAAGGEVAEQSGGSVQRPAKEQLASVGKRALQSFLGGQSGDDFAESLVNAGGADESVYEYAAGLGVEGLLKFMDSTGALQVVPADKVSAMREWVTDFVAYNTPASRDDEGAQDPEALTPEVLP